MGHLAAVISDSAGAGDGEKARGSCRELERRSVVPAAMDTCCSGCGAGGASAGDAGLTGASGAVDEVTFVATAAGGTVGEALVAGTLDVAGRACGRGAVGGAMTSLETGPGARMCAIAATASPDTPIARADTPMVLFEGRYVPGARKPSVLLRNQAICCSPSRRACAPVAS